MFETNEGTVETTTPDTATYDAFIDGFESTEAVVETAPEPIGGDNLDIEASPEPAPDQEAVPESREFAIKYKGKEQTVSRTDAELIADIQKSMDYENVKKELSELKAKYDASRDDDAIYEHFGAENHMSGPDYREYLKSVIAKDSQLKKIRDEFPPETPEAAIQAIYEAREAQRAQEAAKAAEEAEAARLQALIDEAKNEYPNFDIDNLPDPVKDYMEQGYTPLEAMIRHERDELRREKAEAQANAAKQEKEKENRQRSTGGYKNAGSSAGRDPFLEGLFGGG